MGTISLPEALRLRTWGVVTLQRSSGMSGEYDSYQPYLNELAAAVRTACPGARLFIYQTWAYEDGRIIRILPATAVTASGCSRS